MRALAGLLHDRPREAIDFGVEYAEDHPLAKAGQARIQRRPGRTALLATGRRRQTGEAGRKPRSKKAPGMRVPAPITPPA